MTIVAPDKALLNSMSMHSNDGFLHTGAATVHQMKSMEASALSSLGRALASAQAKKIQEAMKDASDYGFDPSQFCYQEKGGQWYTPLLALMARRTQAHMNRALAILKEGPESGWDVSVQQCWVQCADAGPEAPVLLGMEQAAPALLALHAFEASSSPQSTLRLISDEFFEAMDKWDVDWNSQSEDGLTALTEVVRRAPLGLASIVVERLEARGADPLLKNIYGWSAMEYLEQRLSVPVKQEGSDVSAGEKMLARWKSLALDKSLAQAPSSPRRGSRM